VAQFLSGEWLNSWAARPPVPQILTVFVGKGFSVIELVGYQQEPLGEA
jgi:hypothetical protein